MAAGRRAPLSFIEPMAATSVGALPRGPEWSYEIKLDGYRVLALKAGDSVRLLSPRNKDLTRAFPSVADDIIEAARRIERTRLGCVGCEA